MTEGDQINNYVTTISPYKVYMAKAGDVITIKGTYSYVDDANNTIPVTGETKVYAEAPEAWKRDAASGVITALNKNLIKISDKSLDDDVKKGAAWTMDDTTVGFQIYVPYVKSTGTKYEGFGITGVANEYAAYDLKVADETVALFMGWADTTDATKSIAILKANKPGTTSIIIYGVKTDNSRDVIGAANVTVKEARKVGTYTVAAENNKRDLNADYADDKVTFTLDVKDQDGGDYYKAEAVTVVGPTTGDVLLKSGVDKSFSYNRGAKTVSFDITPADVEFATGKNNGTLTLKIKVANIEQVVNISVAAAGPATRYILSVAPTSVDTAIAVGTDKNPAVEIKLQGVAKDGYAASGTAIKFIPYALKAQKSSEYTGLTGYVYNITKDGKIVDMKAGSVVIENFDQVNNKIAAFSKDASASDAAVKLGKGLYIVTAYNVDASGEMLKIEQVGASQTYTVVDNQKSAEVKKNSKAESLEFISQGQVATAFDVSFDGKAMKDWNGAVSVWYDFNDNGATAYVKDAYVTVTNATTGNITIKVPVDTLVKVK